MNTKIRSILILFLTATIWGFAFVAQRVGGDAVGCFTYNGIRFALGCLSLIPVMMIFEKKPLDPIKRKQTIFPGILCGIILFTASTFQQYGVMMTDFAGKAGFITDFYIILVPIIGIFMHHKTTINAWIGAVIALVGFYFLCMNGTFSMNFGDFLIFICAILFAFHIMAIDSYTDRIYPIRFSFYQFLTCSVLSLIGMFLFETVSFSGIQQALIPILYGGILSVGVGYTTQTLGQIGLDPTTSAIILSSESVFCAIGSALILHEVMTTQNYIGCVLVFMGIIIAQLPQRKK